MVISLVIGLPHPIMVMSLVIGLPHPIMVISLVIGLTHHIMVISLISDWITPPYNGNQLSDWITPPYNGHQLSDWIIPPYNGHQLSDWITPPYNGHHLSDWIHLLIVLCLVTKYFTCIITNYFSPVYIRLAKTCPYLFLSFLIVFKKYRDRIIKTLVKLQCSAPCISSYNMKATMCQQCCKSGSSKTYKFVVGRLYVLLRKSHCSQHMATYNMEQPTREHVTNSSKSFICSISFISRHRNCTFRRHHKVKTSSKFLRWELVAMISMVSDNKILLMGINYQ